MGDGNARGRLFYNFVPADDRDASRPILVLMNGGPGAATSSGLLPFGTGPSTLVDGQGPSPRANDSRWTRFAALLYLDSPETGFSYMVGPGEPATRCSHVEEAGQHLLATLAVLSKLPNGRTRKVIFVGQSYGGARALMMRSLLSNADEAPTDALKAAIRAHFGDVGQTPPRSVQRERVLRQFSDIAFIQPFLAEIQKQSEGAMYDESEELRALKSAMMEPNTSRYDVRRDRAWLRAFDDQVKNAYADADARARLLAAPLESIAEFRAEGRRDAVRLPLDPDVEPIAKSVGQALSGTFGALGAKDYFWTPTVDSCALRAGDISAEWLDEAVRVGGRMFLTHARHDAVVYTPAIVRMFTRARWANAAVDLAPKLGVARPGWVRLSPEGSPPTTVRFPAYESGHMVTVGAPAELAEDLEAWVNEGVAVRR